MWRFYLLSLSQGSPCFEQFLEHGFEFLVGPRAPRTPPWEP